VDPRFGVDRFAAVRLGVDRPRDPERLAPLERRAEVVCLLATVSATLPTVTDSGAEPPDNLQSAEWGGDADQTGSG